MKYRAKRQAIRTMTVEQERDLLVRQRDSLIAWLDERRKWCPLVNATEVYKFFLIDPDDHWDEELQRGGSG